MAIEGVELNAMSGGQTAAVDTIDGKEFQVIKLGLGADGVLDTLVDSGQQTMANSLPVVLSSNHSDLKVTLDNEAVVLGAGVAEIGKLAAGVAEIGNVKNSGTFATQATLQTGAATIGKLASNSGVDIGDVTINGPLGGGAEAGAVLVTVANDSTGVLSVDDNGGSLTVDNAALSVTGGGTEASALRVTIANNSTGVLSIDDNGGSLTVDSGATFTVQEDGAALTALQIIDDWDATHDSAIGADGNTIMAEAIETDGTVPGTAVAEADATRLKAGRDGVLLVNQTHPYNFSVSVDYGTAQSNTTIKAAPGAGLKLYITDITISNGATAGNITLLDGSGGTVLYELYAAITGGVESNRRTPLVLTANTLLAITSTSVTTHSVTISGYIAP